MLLRPEKAVDVTASRKSTGCYCVQKKHWMLLRPEKAVDVTASGKSRCDNHSDSSSAMLIRIQGAVKNGVLVPAMEAHPHEQEKDRFTSRRRHGKEAKAPLQAPHSYKPWGASCTWAACRQLVDSAMF
eukprot:364760-Chlamydomonas_euryale.AAC.8